MTPVTISKTGVGRSAVWAVDNFMDQFNIGIGATVTGAATYNIEYSMDDPMDAGYVASSAKWFVASGFSSLEVSTGGAFVVPCKAISINITAGSGTVTAQIVQAGGVR